MSVLLAVCVCLVPAEVRREHLIPVEPESQMVVNLKCSYSKKIKNSKTTLSRSIFPHLTKLSEILSLH